MYANCFVDENCTDLSDSLFSSVPEEHGAVMERIFEANNINTSVRTFPGVTFPFPFQIACFMRLFDFEDNMATNNIAGILPFSKIRVVRIVIN